MSLCRFTLSLLLPFGLFSLRHNTKSYQSQPTYFRPAAHTDGEHSPSVGAVGNIKRRC
ncbi:hypothetical protein IB211_02131c [Intestinimonas butyriciproducens]|uniref:Uncharacterized protein n=1 Tax=Intestinimonas butyriciproducens TaxID=1297617 RepID=A0A0S2W592_9FIRM|nr:hypothetical protein IB211_02131c [Intestinimonas butyriciproducens]